MVLRAIGPTGHWSYGPLVLRVIGPTCHWSYVYTIGPTGHWSYGPLVLRVIGPTGHWSYGPLVLMFRPLVLRAIDPTACDITLILSGKSAFEIALIPPGYLVIGVYI